MKIPGLDQVPSNGPSAAVYDWAFTNRHFRLNFLPQRSDLRSELMVRSGDLLQCER
jgi:hypothetical protein